MFRLVVEGETEKRYFESMPTPRGKGRRIRAEALGQDVHRIIQRAAELVCDEYDVWAVFDTECADVSEALAQARSSHVEVAVSNPCFEVWLILHHRNWTRPFQSAQEAKRRLRDIQPMWSESNTYFKDFENGVGDACGRARQLPEPPDGNPSTSVWRLVELIRRAHRGSAGDRDVSDHDHGRPMPGSSRPSH